MTDDQFWRILITGAAIVAVGIFKAPLMRWLRRIGYRDWRE